MKRIQISDFSKIVIDEPDIKRVYNKEELLSLLKKHKGILSNEMIDYLNSLINLEFSVVKGNISDLDREILTDLELYRKIAMYNILNRVAEVLKPYKDSIDVRHDGIGGLDIYAALDNRSFKIFDYTHESVNFDSSLSPYYGRDDIGEVSLYRTISDRGILDEEKMAILEKLDILYKVARRHDELGETSTYGGCINESAYLNRKEIRELENRYTNIDNKDSLTKNEEREIEATGKFNEILLADFGLDIDDFESSDESLIGGKKTLIKNMPNMNIKNNIRCI